MQSIIQIFLLLHTCNFKINIYSPQKEVSRRMNLIAGLKSAYDKLKDNFQNVIDSKYRSVNITLKIKYSHILVTITITNIKNLIA
jgi:hypothetical protein